MSSLAVVTVVKTSENTAMKSIRAHDFDLLIMLTSFAAGSHHGKKRVRIYQRRNHFNHTLAQSHFRALRPKS
jgi:hypothetical protein